MEELRPRNGKVLGGWFLFNVVVQGIYLFMLYRDSRRNSILTSMTGFYVLIALSGIYFLLILVYLLMPGVQTRGFDLGFIVWGCATTVLISLAWVLEGLI